MTFFASYDMIVRIGGYFLELRRCLRDDFAAERAAAAFPARTALPSSPVRSSTEFAACAKALRDLGVLAFRVWREASALLNGIFQPPFLR